jgi:hypothetical protein
MITFSRGQSVGATMTIYKDGYGLVKQPVTWDVTSGLNTVRYDRVPQGMVADSPFLNIQGINIYTQRLDFDTFSGENFFRSKLGSRVEIRLNGDKAFSGTLLEYTGTAVTLQDKSNIRSFARSAIDGISLKEVVEDPQFRPILSWDVNSSKSGKANGELVYTSGGFDWNATYRMIVKGDSAVADFIPEAIITNRSNLAFSSLTLQLVEGTLSRVHPLRPGFYQPEMMMRTMGDAALSEAPMPTREVLGDYHIYSLPGVVKIGQHESITVRLYFPRDIRFIKTYLFDNDERSQREEPLTVQLKVENSTENNLGIPLPQGKVDLYQLTDDGLMEFLGQDQIKQVPKDATAEFIAGRAFDVIGKRRVLNYDRQRKSEEASIEIVVTNTRDQDVLVHVIERISGDWVIREESTMYIKDDASTIHFPITVPSGGQETVTYTYRKEWN